MIFDNLKTVDDKFGDQKVTNWRVWRSIGKLETICELFGEQMASVAIVT